MGLSSKASINREGGTLVKEYGMAKSFWSKTFEYRRLLEILYDYWLSQKEEEYVEINMFFKHKDGRIQHKQITWENRA